MHLLSDMPYVWLGSASKHGLWLRESSVISSSWFWSIMVSPDSLSGNLPTTHLSLLSSFLPTLPRWYSLTKGPIQSNCLATEHLWAWNLKVTWGNLTSGPKNFSTSFFLHFSFIQGRLKGLLLYHLKKSHVFFCPSSYLQYVLYTLLTKQKF